MSTLTNSKELLCEELNQKLQRGIVTFSYLKSNPTDKTKKDIREAVGTTNMTLIDPTGVPKTQNVSTITKTSQKYYDLTKKSWRSLTKENILNISAFVSV